MDHLYGGHQHLARRLLGGPGLQLVQRNLRRRHMGGDFLADQTLSCAIAVMAKASIPGRAKTRLVPPLTADEAAALNTSFLRDVADNLIGASVHANISGYMAFAPARSEEHTSELQSLRHLV